MRLIRKRHVSPSHRMPPALKYRSSKIGKVSKTTKGKVKSRPEMKPVRMRQWLEELLNEESCEGLKWQDRLKNIFEICWCHASRHDFEPGKHADVFLQYAQFTGRTNVVSSSKNGYNSKLKSNFRSALHSLIDCIQVKDTEGARGKTVKVYQFIEPSHPEYKKRKARKNKSQRKAKMQKVTSSCSTLEAEPILKDETVEQAEFPIEGSIILPDDAVSFIESQNVTTEYQQILSLELPYTPIPTTTSIVSPIHHQPLNPIIPEPPKATPGNIQGSITHLDFCDTTACQPQKAPELPDFGALGMDDTFQNPVQHTCPKFKSGGNVFVKKEKPFLPQLEVENFLKQTKPAPVDRILNMAIFDDPFMANDSATLNQVHVSSQCQEIAQRTVFQTDIDVGTVLYPNVTILTSDSIPGDTNSQRVLIQMQNVNTSLQGENYDLYDVGNLDQ